jgi:hypothetical protein
MSALGAERARVLLGSADGGVRMMRPSGAVDVLSVDRRATGRGL